MAVILIVEDDSCIRELAKMIIRAWGHQTLSAGDADEALSILGSPQHVDLLYTDIYLKTAVLGGCDLAHLATKLRPKLRVLYTTGNFVTDKIKTLLIDGAHCLRKPYTVPQLQNSIEGLLAACCANDIAEGPIGPHLLPPMVETVSHVGRCRTIRELGVHYDMDIGLPIKNF